MRRRRRFFALAEGALILVFLVLAAIIANRLLAARLRGAFEAILPEKSGFEK